MSGLSNPSIVQRDLQRILRIVQNFPQIANRADGGMREVTLSEEDKVALVSRFITQLGTQLTKKTGRQILQIVQSKIAPDKKVLQVHKVLLKQFPNLKLPGATKEDVYQWMVEQYASCINEQIRRKPGLSEGEIPAKDSQAYQVLVKDCGVPSHVAELLLYRTRIGNAVYTFVPNFRIDGQGYDKIDKFRDISIELALHQKKYVLAFEGSYYKSVPHFFSLEKNIIHFLLSGILRNFLEMKGDEGAYQIKFRFGIWLFTEKVMQNLWSKLRSQVSSNAELRHLVDVFADIDIINAMPITPEEKAQEIERLYFVTKEEWITFFKELIKIALKEMKISEAYRSNVETLLKDPTNEKALDEYSRESWAIRQEIMAETLFACDLPEERIVSVDRYQHIAGIVAHLKRLAAGKSKHPDLDQKEKSSSKPSKASPEKKSSDKRPLAKGEVPSACARELQNRIPDSNWGRNAAQQKVWYQGTEEDAKEIGEYLKDNGITVEKIEKDKRGNWFVMLANPDLGLIEKLPSFEEWKKKKASKEKASSREDAVNRLIRDSLKDSDFPTLAEISKDTGVKEQLDNYVQKLEKRVPGTKWSTNTVFQEIWFVGKTEEEAKEIAQYLKEYCIKTSEPSLTLTANWVVMLTNLDFEQIDHLPSFEYWKNRKKSEEIEPSDKDSFKNELARCADELEKRLPGTKWKKNPKQQIVWFEGTKEKTKEIQKHLKAHCIKARRQAFTEGDKYAVTIKNPDFTLIEKLAQLIPKVDVKLSTEEVD